jgi:hypothetical protein
MSDLKVLRMKTTSTFAARRAYRCGVCGRLIPEKSQYIKRLSEDGTYYTNEHLDCTQASSLPKITDPRFNANWRTRAKHENTEDYWWSIQ